jgi:phosphoglycerate dehydrogenase-like enzyme
VNPAAAAECGVRLVPLEALLEQSDVVTLHVPLTDETAGMIGAEALARMRPGAHLINTARGAVVSEAALAAAIEAGSIAGAAIDVFEAEPLALDSPLRRLDPERVILTPHSVGSNLAMRETGTRMAIGAIIEAMAGRSPEHVLNAEAVGTWRVRFGGPLA